MSQRNPNNNRYKEDGKKGVTRSAAGRAKPKSKAGSSVYVAKSGPKTKTKTSSSKKVTVDNEKDAKIITKANEAVKDYTYFRNVWIALIVIAVVGVVVGFIAPRTMVEGGALAQFAEQRYVVQLAGVVTGYAALIAAFIVDWRKIRPIRTAQKLAGGKAPKESKKERAHREAAEAAKAANKKSLFGRKKD